LCQQLKKNSPQFRLEVVKNGDVNGDLKVYEFEAASVAECVEMCSRITFLMKKNAPN
jgi:hypothetical protein